MLPLMTGNTSLNCWLWLRQPGCCRWRRLLVGWAACLSLGSPVWKNPKHEGKWVSRDQYTNVYLRTQLALHIGVIEYIGQPSICTWMVGSCPQRWPALHIIIFYNSQHSVYCTVDVYLLFIIKNSNCSACDWERSGLLEENPQSGCSDICASLKGPL